jgi:hypothetical protein
MTERDGTQHADSWRLDTAVLMTGGSEHGPPGHLRESVTATPRRGRRAA